MQKKFISIILILLSVIAFVSEAQASEYRVLTQKNDKDVAYKANDFYSIFYVYMNVIVALDMEKRLSPSVVRKVVFETVDNLKHNRFSQLQVKGYKGPQPLRITMRTDVLGKDKKPILWLVSNFSPREGAVVTGDALRYAYATYYYLMGDKLVKYQRLKEPKTPAQLAAMSVNDRADYYLMDEKASNDRAGKEMLIKALKKAGKPADKAIMNLTLSEYYLLDGDVKGAEARIDKAREILPKVSGKPHRLLKEVLHYSEQLAALYRGYEAR